MSLAAIRTILVPTDFSAASEEAVRAAVELAQTWGATVELLHVGADSPLVGVPDVNFFSTSAAASGGGESAPEQTQLEAVAARVRRWKVECRTSTAVGRTHVEIVEHAVKIGAGLIAMGTHERHGISHTLLGGVAEKVLRHTPCPVLVVPWLAAGAEEPVASLLPLGSGELAEAT